MTKFSVYENINGTFYVSESDALLEAGAPQVIADYIPDLDMANKISALPELIIMLRAFKSYLDDDSRSQRRREECILSCNCLLYRLANPNEPKRSNPNDKL